MSVPGLLAPTARDPQPLPPALPAWWPLVRQGAAFQPLDKQQCWRLLAGSGAAWLSCPCGERLPRLPVRYVVTDRHLVLYGAQHPAELLGQVVALQVDLFDAARSCGWSVMVVGCSTEALVGAAFLPRGLGLPLVLEQAGVVGRVLVAPPT